MVVDTDAFRALPADVERMAGEVARMSDTLFALSAREVTITAVYEAGRQDERKVILGDSGARRPRRKRPGHLCAVGAEGRP